MSMYQEIKDALKDQIANHLNDTGEVIDVYKVPYQNIAVFPAVALELNSRRKPKRGVGVRELEVDMVVWVYVDILDVEDAEEECIRIVNIVEQAIEKDRKLGGACHYLDIDDNINFGTVQQGEATFLQGAKIPITIKKRYVEN